MSDSTSPIDLIAASQAQKEVTANAAFNAASPAMLYSRRATTTAGLTWGVYGGRWNGAAIANSTVTLTASATNYVVALRSTGAVSVSTATTNWDNTADYLRLYQVVTSSTAPTSWQDHRQCYGGALGAGTGDVIGPASSTDNTLPRFSGTGGKSLKTSGVLVGDNNQMSGYRGDLNAQTGTTYTLVAADTGKVVECTNAAAITLTLPATAAVGFCCTVVQGGAGQITLTPASGATLRNRQGHTKTAGLWAGVALYVRSNAGGSAAEYVMLGDSAP
jgi:hypothetical protein